MLTEITTDKDEQNCEIRIIVRTDRWGVNKKSWGIQIDNTITPLYCCNCKTQLKRFYKLNGGRYGNAGSVVCICGAEIHCTDSDNIVEYLDTVTTFRQSTVGRYYIDFTKTYKLYNSAFIAIKENLGFDIFKSYANQTIGLKEIINELEKDYGVSIDKDQKYICDKFEYLPGIINKWYSILEHMNK